MICGKQRRVFWCKWLMAVMGALCVMITQGVASAGDATSSKRKKYEVVFPVKLFCSQKYPVIVPFKGRIEEVLVDVGRKVKQGDVLARYALSLEAVAALRKDLLNPRVKELEMELAQVASDLVDLSAIRDRLLKMGSEDPRADANGVLKKIEAREILKEAVNSRLDLEKAFALDARKLLSEKLGQSLILNDVPDKAFLNATLEGYVIWVNPEFKKGAEISEGFVAFEVGVMNPLTARAEVFENEALQIAPGDQGKMIIESMREREFDVVTTYVSWVPSSSGILNPSYYMVEMSVSNADLLLREGLMGNVRFSGSR